MAISLADINRVTLRAVFLPWWRQLMADYGMPLAADWNPTDEELERLAARVREAFREEEAR
jgi:hypothetical protein